MFLHNSHALGMRLLISVSEIMQIKYYFKRYYIFKYKITKTKPIVKKLNKKRKNK